MSALNQINKPYPFYSTSRSDRMHKGLKQATFFKDSPRKELYRICRQREKKHKSNIRPCLRSRLPLPLRKLYRDHLRKLFLK